MKDGVRPSKLWHWAVILVLIATFLAEPRAAAALSWDMFRLAGSIGGELITGGTDDERDLLHLNEDPPFDGLLDNPAAPNTDGFTDPDVAPDSEGALTDHGCAPENSCFYGIMPPEPEEVVEVMQRLREVTDDVFVSGGGS